MYIQHTWLTIRHCCNTRNICQGLHLFGASYLCFYRLCIYCVLNYITRSTLVNGVINYTRLLMPLNIFCRWFYWNRVDCICVAIYVCAHFSQTVLPAFITIINTIIIIIVIITSTCSMVRWCRLFYWCITRHDKKLCRRLMPWGNFTRCVYGTNETAIYANLINDIIRKGAEKYTRHVASFQYQ